MEFTRGRDRERLNYITEQEEAWKHAPLVPSSSSSSSSPSSYAPFTWNDGSSGGASGGDNSSAEKEHMFDKVVTPSDVGKLNRLVIPKQHAERFFPLDASADGAKGMLLSFEDRTGKSWRFRYSYWNSSQSYVMTKGWSRFVKEKRLSAGDTVSFGRGVGEPGRDRLYIDWKRRPESHGLAWTPRIPIPGLSFPRSVVGPWGGHHYMPPAAAAMTVYHRHLQGYGYNVASPSAVGGQALLYFRSPATGPPHIEVQPDGGVGSLQPMVLDSVPVAHSQAMAKRVRLFGVNLLCPDTEGDAAATAAGTSLSFLQSQEASAFPHLQFQHSSAESSLASSSSTSKEQHSYLDLDL